jgi:ribosome maturation factor RimP
LAKWALEAPIFVDRRKEDSVTDIYTREKALEREIAPAVERSLPGVEVLALELVSPSRICVYVDHPSGVDHALCERVTHLLDPWRSRFAIDVSSPGPERPLRKPAHFARALGSRVSVRTPSTKRVNGTVVRAGQNVLVLAVADGEQVEIPYEEIVRGNLIDEG